MFYRTGTSENIEAIGARGRALWRSIYEPHADKLYEKLGSYHPDFIGGSYLFKESNSPFFFFLFWALSPNLDPKLSASSHTA